MPKPKIDRKIRFQYEASPTWTKKVLDLPGCDNLLNCIQCGTCSGTCPLSIYMDYTPRRIIAMIREGFREDALQSQTIWLCASCYSCVVHCPQNIRITDVMYALKREAIRCGVNPRRFAIPVLAQELYKIAFANGRSSEMSLGIRLMMRTNPLKNRSSMKLAWNLFRTGRLSFRKEKIKGRKELRDALSAVKEES